MLWPSISSTLSSPPTPLGVLLCLFLFLNQFLSLNLSQHGVPAFTVPQPEEAMHVLEDRALELNVHLQVAAPLNPNFLGGLHLGLDGEHQYTNAGLAVALCSTWLQQTGQKEVNYVKDAKCLPEQFIRGLSTAALQGRAQIVPDHVIETECSRNLVFHLDGAHSPESMDVCGKWFSLEVKEAGKPHEPLNDSKTLPPTEQNGCHVSPKKSSMQILLFNCMAVRDPQLLLPRLINACAVHGVQFTKALFVPNTSVYYKVGTSALPAADSEVDLTWQFTLQRVWENLVNGEKGRSVKSAGITFDECTNDAAKGEQSFENSHVFPSLPLAINWLRETSRRNQSVRLQVLVTGSLHLVGDVLRLVKK